MLNNLFMADDCGRAIGLAYITGIIPIARVKVHSPLCKKPRSCQFPKLYGYIWKR